MLAVWKKRYSKLARGASIILRLAERCPISAGGKLHVGGKYRLKACGRDICHADGMLQHVSSGRFSRDFVKSNHNARRLLEFSFEFNRSTLCRGGPARRSTSPFTDLHQLEIDLPLQRRIVTLQAGEPLTNVLGCSDQIAILQCERDGRGTKHNRCRNQRDEFHWPFLSIQQPRPIGWT